MLDIKLSLDLGINAIIEQEVQEYKSSQIIQEHKAEPTMDSVSINPKEPSKWYLPQPCDDIHPPHIQKPQWGRMTNTRVPQPKQVTKNMDPYTNHRSIDEHDETFVESLMKGRGRR